ncbi:MAG: outer membrane protein assembly factor BamD [Gammaproteobacteria bacterium]|nr:outer membrane protein assembly factor BamD [Gammaproteobacteria bacterium]
MKFRLLLISITLLLNACASLEKEESADWKAEQFYKQAKRDLDKGSFEQAIANFQLLEARYPFGSYTQQAQLDLAYAYYKFDEHLSAISSADHFIKLHPRHQNVDYAYYLKGLANFHRGQGLTEKFFKRDYSKINQRQLKDAYQSFDTLIRKFPDSRYNADARQRMIFLRNKMAQHELQTAQYYFKRSAYIAVVNRGHYILSHFDGAPSIPNTLALMAQAYEKLDMPELAKESWQILQENQADHPALASR